jgi:hypothetical protein
MRNYNINVEVRHMNDIEANFVLNKTEYLGSMTLQEYNQQAIYSNMREIVEQQHLQLSEDKVNPKKWQLLFLVYG